MILKNDALQDLYYTLVSAGVSMSRYADSPVYEAFKECDEKLSESIAFKHIKDIQNRCDNLERSNKALRDDNDKLGDKVIGLNKKNEQLEKDIDICKRSNEMLLASSMESISEKRKLENEIKDLKKDLDAKSKENSALVSANADLSDRNAKLQRNFDRINRLWTDQIQENMELRSKITNMQREKKNYETIAKEREDLLKERDDIKRDSDAWQRRAKYAEKELDLAKRNRDGWKSRAMHAEKRYAELRKENADLSEKVVDIKKRITELQKKGDDLTKKSEDLQQEIEELKKSRKHLRRLYVGEGARKLWDMLQNVNDVEPEEFDPEFKTLSDILCMDLEEFLDEYEKWQKEKEQKKIDRMRDWLADFCEGKVCKGCPLESKEYKCGCGYSFKKANESDTRIIPDEDVKRYYEKARGCGQYTLKDATFYSDNKPVIMGGTLEATVEVDKDLLTKVCGVAPKEEEHQLDYGDAVRVPWRDYDYMYIDADNNNHIRLFNPKIHTVVLVSPSEKLTYQGSKIILCNEDDIRKIWKDKK